MAVTATNLTAAYDGVDRTIAYTTASITPTANRLVLAWIWSAKTSTPETPTLSGNSLTWVQITTQTNGAGNRRFTMFRAMGGSPTSGAVSIDHAGASMIGCSWIIAEFSGVKTSGTNGSDAIVQSDTNTGFGTPTSGGPTLAAFSDTNNATAAALALQLNETVSMEAGYTSLGNPGGTTPNLNFRGEFLATNDTTPSFSWTTGTSNIIFAGVEIASADATTTPSAITIPIAIPQVTATRSETATPPAISVPVATPSASAKADSVATPSPIAVPITVPQVSGSASHTATPGAVTVPATLPTPTLQADSTATPNVVSVPVTLPTPTIAAAGDALPDALAVPITVPSVAVTASSTATPGAILVPISIPQVTATGTGAGTALPDAVAVTISLPSPSGLADSVALPAPLPVPIAIPQITGSASHTATPDAVTVPITVPASSALADSTATPDAIPVPVSIPQATASATNPDGTATPGPIDIGITFPPPTVSIPKHGSRGVIQRRFLYQKVVFTIPVVFTAQTSVSYDWSFEEEELELLILVGV